MTARPTYNQWLEQLKNWSAEAVAEKLGAEVVRHGRDTSFDCPRCRKRLRHTKTSAVLRAAKVMPDGRWWCEPCGAAGDVVALACALVTGRTAKLEAHQWAQVREACTNACLLSPTNTARVLAPSAELSLPSRHEVVELWQRGTALGPECIAYLTSRGFDCTRIETAAFVRMAPRDGLAFEWFPPGRSIRWPLMFLARDFRGEPASIQCRALTPDVTPKSLWPKKRSSRGLVFADSNGATLLESRARHDSVAGLDAIVVAEGATDTLKLSSVVEGTGETWAVLGYYSGSYAALASINWPPAVPVIIAVHNDDKGDAYAVEIVRAIQERAPVFRVRSPQGRDGDGHKIGDWSDLSDAQVLAAFETPSAWEMC